MRDIANEIHPVVAIPPAAAVTDNTVLRSAIIDKAGYESLAFLINIGALGTQAATFAVSLVAGDDPSLADGAPPASTNLTGTLALASFTGANAGKSRKIGYTGAKRYVQLVITPANNAAAAFISALALLSDGRFIPTPNPPS